MKLIRLNITKDGRGYICDSKQVAGTPPVGIGPTVIEAINNWFSYHSHNYCVVGVDSKL
jgi:hypothetical protein